MSRTFVRTYLRKFFENKRFTEGIYEKVKKIEKRRNGVKLLTLSYFKKWEVSGTWLTKSYKLMCKICIPFQWWPLWCRVAQGCQDKYMTVVIEGCCIDSLAVLLTVWPLYWQFGRCIDSLAVVLTVWLLYWQFGCYIDSLVIVLTVFSLYCEFGCCIDSLAVVFTNWPLYW